MENEFKHMDLIESYLRDELNPKMAGEFAEQMAADPNLRSDVNFQRNVIEGVKSIRKSELKARLNRIDIGGSGSSSSLTAKILTGAAFITALGVGAYFLTQKKSSATSPQIAQKKQEVAKPEELSGVKAEEESQEIVATTTGPDSVQNKNMTPSLLTKKSEKVIAKNENIKSTKTTPTENATQTTVAKSTELVKVIPPVAVPDVVTDFSEDEELTSSEDLNFEDNTISAKDESAISKFEIENIKDSKYSFNYRFKKGKLLLYGNFSESTYEIIELNTTQGKRVYLYYSDKFYPLNEEQSKIADLTALTDKSLIEELNKIKSGN